MATVLTSSLLAFDPAELPTEPVKRWTVSEYHNLIRLGVLTEDHPYELIEGWLVTKLIRNPPHDYAISRLNQILTRTVPDNFVVRPQLAITLDDGEPEPDFSIVIGPAEKYEESHPTASEILLVIEIADSTLARDRSLKLRTSAFY